jgi:general secretion pathway protein C
MVNARITSFLKEHGWVLNLLFIMLGAYFVAGAANSVLARSIRTMPTIDDVSTSSRPRPAHSAASPKEDLVAIATRNLLGASRESLQPEVLQPDLAAESIGNTFKETDLRPCTIPHAVRATLVADGAPEWSMAVLYSNTDQTPTVYSINESTNRVADDIHVIDIRERAVVVRRRDHFELCHCEGDQAAGTTAVAMATPPPAAAGDGGGPGVTMVSETQYTVERSEVDGALANLSEVATQARIVPSFKNGKPNGFKLFSIKPGSIYSKIGLKNGDVLHKINGYEINSPDKALEIYQKLKDASSVSIELERRGQMKNMGYTIR